MNNRTFTQDLLGVQNDLLRFAYKLTSNREEANDLLQETSLKALDNEEKYTPDTNYKGWIYTIMRNIFINNYRKVVRDQTFVDTTDNLYHLNTPNDLTLDSTEGDYDLKEMHRIVNALPREYKIPFSMHISGFKCREIAEKRGARVEFKRENTFLPFFIPEDSEMIQIVTESLKEMGIEPQINGGGGGMDGNIFNQKGITCVGIATGYFKNHSTEEYLHLDDFYHAGELVARIIGRIA